jgi:multidrug efflux pump subunit AcrB
VQPKNHKSLRQRFNISRFAIANSWLTVCFWLFISVVGIFAFSSLKYALFPDITFPVVVVNAKAPLDTLPDTETKLTKILEQPLQSLIGLEDLASSTYTGQSVLTLAFSPGTDLELSTKKVETEIDKLTLPDEATVEVIPFNLNESVAISYAITSKKKSLKELTQIAQEQIIPPIAQLPGILKVNVLGDASGKEDANSNKIDYQKTLVRFNRENSIAFQVVKQGSANTLEVVKRVEELVQKLQAELPEVRIILAQTEANYIQEATQATIDSLLLAVVLAVVIIYPFLRNWQATLITTLAIPTSLLGTFIVMALFGFNLETITLLALALVIGIIVDDAIVDVENISRYIEAGKSPKEAALIGTDEIGLTVSASTLTIAAVFIPVAFMGGTVGQFFKAFGITVSASVLISLLVARTLSPVLAVWWLKPKETREEEDLSRGGVSPPLLENRERERQFDNNKPKNGYYYRLLQWSLNHRKIIIGITVACFIAGVALIPLIPKGFIPKLDRGEFNIVYTTPLPKLNDTFSSNTPPTNNLAPTSESDGNFSWLSDLSQNPERLLLTKTRKVGEQLEESALKSPAVESVFTIAGIRGEPNKGKIYVKLKSDRQLHTAEVQEQIRTTLPKIAGVSTSVEDIQFVDTGGEKPLKVGIVGEDLAKLKTILAQIKSQVEKLPGFEDVSTTNKDTQIDRINGQRVAYITANLDRDKGLGDATQQVIVEAKKILPPDFSLNLAGDTAHSDSVFSSFAGTFALSTACMLLFLILPFRRLLEPLVIGFSLPLAIVGALLGLLVTQSNFGIISLIGLIFLLGLLDKNAILLMDYANQLRESGLNRTEALLQTGAIRLRPILMTTGSTILGMLPIALGIGAGSELRQPMAVAIIGGLITSTLLSSIVVPVLYTILEDLWRSIRAKR